MCRDWHISDIIACSNLTNCVFVDVKQTIPDWREYLMTKLVGAHTLPVDFYLKVKLNAEAHNHLSCTCEECDELK